MMSSRSRRRRCAGATMTEYIIIIVVVAVALIYPLNWLRDSMTRFLLRSKQSLCAVVDGTPGGDPPIDF